MALPKGLCVRPAPGSIRTNTARRFGSEIAATGDEIVARAQAVRLSEHRESDTAPVVLRELDFLPEQVTTVAVDGNPHRAPG